jgi:hypothetical protein
MAMASDIARMVTTPETLFDLFRMMDRETRFSILREPEVLKCLWRMEDGALRTRALREGAPVRR